MFTTRTLKVILTKQKNGNPSQGTSFRNSSLLTTAKCSKSEKSDSSHESSMEKHYLTRNSRRLCKATWNPADRLEFILLCTTNEHYIVHRRYSSHRQSKRQLKRLVKVARSLRKMRQDDRQTSTFLDMWNWLYHEWTW